jgi:uncharacterized membrane protein YjgN (DUF898 family)
VATEIAASASGPAPSAGKRLVFHGDGITLFGLYVVSLFLTLITLGVYYSWARARIRTYLLSQTEFDADRFAWHGTGKELFIGFLKVAALFLILYAVAAAVRFGWHHPASEVVLRLGGYIVGLILVPIAIVGARRYRLSRVSWRGIRFSFRGRAREFLSIFVAGTLLSVITLGLYYPVFLNNMRHYLVNRSFFGATPFQYDGRGRDLFLRFLLAFALSVAGIVGLGVLLFFAVRPAVAFTPRVPPLGIAVGFAVLSLVLLGLIWFEYAAFRNRYYWGHTSFAGARFRSSVTAARLMGLTLTNLLLAGVTLGLALPWVLIRTLRFIFANVSLEGPVDLAAIQQDAQAASPTGGALGDAMDIGFFDVDLAL